MLIRLLVGVPLAFALLVFLLMRSPLIGSLVASAIQEQTGCVFKAGRAALGVDGRLIVQDLSVRVDGLDGEAGELLSAKRAVVDLDWSGVFSGNVRPTGMLLEEPVFRLSVSRDDGSLNLDALAAGQGGTRKGLPRIDALNGRIEFGEHSARTGGYETLNTIRVAGALTQPDPAAPVYTVRLQEIGRTSAAPGGPRGMVLDGRLDLSTDDASLRLLNVSLDAWPAESVPEAYRDIWRRLNVQGLVSETRLEYSKAAGVGATVTLAGVSMQALIPAEGAEITGPLPGPPADLTLRGVNGTVSLSQAGLKADLEGQIEDQKASSRVVLETRGLGLDAALRCEITGRRITVPNNPEFLPYVPRIVQKHFRRFSGPTADVDARVVITRAAPTEEGPSPIRVEEGRLVFRDGTAAYYKFPYPFKDMRGVVSFTDQRLDIVNVQARGPTGATLTASGFIAPLNEDPETRLSVHVTGAPVDEHLLAALPEDRRRILEVLFSRERHAELIGAGLLRDPLGSPDVQPEAAPEFALGGLADIDVSIHRPEVFDADWDVDVTVKFAEAGMIPEPFPLPITARGVELRIDDERAEVVAGDFRGLAGGRATMDATVRLRDGDRNVVEPDIRIHALDVPVDALLLNAVPDGGAEGAAAGGGSGGGPTVKTMLRQLDISGRVDCVATITGADGPRPLGPGEVGPPAPGSEVDYLVEVGLDKLTAAPAPEGEAALIGVRELSGTMSVDPRRARVQGLRATLARLEPGSASAADEGAARVGELTIDLDAALDGAGAEAGSLRAGVKAAGLDLSAPVDRLVAVFSPEAGAALTGEREARKPSGRVDVGLTVTRAGPAADGGPSPARVGLEVGRAEGLSFEGLGGRVGVLNPAGSAVLETGERRAVRFSGASADLSFNGSPSGRVAVEGLAVLDADGALRGPSDLAARLSGWRVESPLARAAVRRFAGEENAGAMERLELEGGFDATARLDGGSGSTAPVVSGRLEPRSASLVRRGTPVVFDRVAGAIGFRSQPAVPNAGEGPPEPVVTGTFEGLEAETTGWSAAADGSWTYRGGEGVGIDGEVSLSGSEFDAALRALLPESVSGAMDALEAQLAGPFELEPSRLRLDLRADPTLSSAGFEGRLVFSDASVSAGVPLEHIDGSLSVRVAEPSGAPTGEGAAVELLLEAQRATAAAISLTSVRALVVSGPEPDQVLVPYVTADCHGGRVWGKADARLGGPGGTVYRADLTMAGVRFAPVLRDVAAAGFEATPSADAEGAGAGDRLAPVDESRGSVDAWVSISGVAGDLDSRVGRGAIRIANGDVVRLPVILPLIQVSNLVVPSGDRLHYLQTTFHIDGAAAAFEEIVVLSRTVALLGSGTLTWPDMALDMRFNSKSNRRIPIWSDLFEAVRDEIVSTTITGTLQEPQVRSRALAGTRRVIGGLVGADGAGHDGAHEVDTSDAEEAARREMARMNGGESVEPARGRGGRSRGE